MDDVAYPCEKLWRAVITRAILDASGYFEGPYPKTYQLREQHRLATWIRSKDFQLICDMACLNPTPIRRAIETTIAARPTPKAA